VQEICAAYLAQNMHKSPAHLIPDPNRYLAPISQSLPLINRLPPPPRSSRASSYLHNFCIYLSRSGPLFCPAFKSFSARAFPGKYFFDSYTFLWGREAVTSSKSFPISFSAHHSSFPYSLPIHTVLRRDQPCKLLPTMAPKDDLEAASGFDVEKQTGTQSSDYSSDIEPAETQDEEYDSDRGNPDPDHNEVASMDRGHMADLLTMKSHVSLYTSSPSSLILTCKRPLGKPVENQSRMKLSSVYPQLEQPEAGSLE
jgi:hypothetical protein